MPLVAVYYYHASASNQLFRCSVGMSTATCLGCNGAADAHDRRLLSGPTSMSVLSAWKEIIATKVQADRSLETAAAQVQVLIQPICAESASHCLTAITKPKDYSLPILNQFYPPSQVSMNLLVPRGPLQR